MDPNNVPRATPQIDGRTEPRVPVAWRGMLLLPTGRACEARVRDISESGLGMVTSDPVPNMAVIQVAVAVPDLIDVARSITIRGKFRTAYVVINGHDYRIGGTWTDLDNASREMLRQHIKRHRYSNS